LAFPQTCNNSLWMERNRNMLTSFLCFISCLKSYISIHKFSQEYTDTIVIIGVRFKCNLFIRFYSGIFRIWFLIFKKGVGQYYKIIIVAIYALIECYTIRRQG
jgi:hypothetical protein